MTVVTSNTLQERGAAWSGEVANVFVVPAGLLDRYVSVALQSAVPRKLDDGRWYVDLPDFPGVWADGESPKNCLDTLEEVLREWLFVKLIDGDRDIPLVDQIDLTPLINQR